jgi:nitroreductase
MSVDFSLRDPLSGVLEQLSHRWSPRAFTKTVIADEILARILDAARFAPSCFNAQPWSFYTSNEQNFNDYLSLLNESNQSWAKDAGVICFLVGKKHFEHNGKANAHYAFDCGAAWMSLVLQAQHEGLYCHGMAGIQKQKIESFLNINTETDDVLIAFVIGNIGSKESLPDNFREKETPSSRKKLDQIWRTK